MSKYKNTNAVYFKNTQNNSWNTSFFGVLLRLTKRLNSYITKLFSSRSSL